MFFLLLGILELAVTGSMVELITAGAITPTPGAGDRHA